MASRTTWSQHILPLFVVACAATWLFSALLEPQAFASHEGVYVYARTHQIAVELSAGRFPQSFPDAFFGAGFAFPRFYPPLTLFMSAGLALLLGSVVVAVNLSFYLSVLASGIAMYAMVIGILRNRWIATGTALLYVSMPYRFVDIYVRAALAEAWTFVWYPLILLGLWRAVTRRTMPWYLPVSICGLVLTHNITAVYFLAYCGVFTLFAMALRGWRIGLIPAACVVLGILLGMWFLLPQQYYIPTVWVGDSEFMWTNAAHVQEHRVYPWQFFYSHPNYWFGETGGPEYSDGMSFELGIGQLLLLPLLLWMGRKFQWRERVRRSPILAVLGGSALVVYVTCILFMMYPIAFLSVLPKQFAFIQFPWRTLAMTAFLAPLMAAILVTRLGRQRAWLVPAFAIVSALVVFLVPSFQSTPQSEEHWTEDAILTRDALFTEGRTGYTVLGEYVPREIDVETVRKQGLESGLFEPPRIVEGADASVLGWSRSGPDFHISVAAKSGGVVQLPLFFYDFYEASNRSGDRLETMSIGGMLGIRVPPGLTEVYLGQRLTGPSRVGFAISGMSLLAVIGCAVWFRQGRPPKRTERESIESDAPRTSTVEGIGPP